MYYQYNLETIREIDSLRPVALNNTLEVKNYFQLVILFIILLFISCNNKEKPDFSETLQVILKQYPIFVNISPNGKNILFKNRNKETFELGISNINELEFDTINTSNFTQLSLTWHPNEKEIIFQEFSPFTKKYHLYKLDLLTKNKTPIDLPPSSNAIPPLRFSKSGNLLAYIATDISSVLYIYDYMNKNIISYFGDVDSDSDFHFSNDSIIYYLKGLKNPVLKKSDVHSREVWSYNILEHGEIHNFSIKGNHILFSGRAINEEFFQCYEFSLDNNIRKKLTSSECNVSDCNYSKYKSIFYYIQNENGINKLYCSDSVINNQINSLNGSTKIVSEQQDKLIIRNHSLKSPPELLEFDFIDSKINLLHSSMFKKEISVESPNFLEISSEHSNQVIPAYFWKSTTTNLENKTIIYVHGGPKGLGQSRPIWNVDTKLLNQNGFNLLKLNYHGSSGYSKQFETDVDLSKQYLDIIESVKYLKGHYNINNNDIILVGSSYGGKLVLKASYYLKNLKGVVLISGIYNHEIIDEKMFRELNIHCFYGDLDPLTIGAIKFFDYNNKMENFVVFRNERHTFHKSNSWARIYGTIVKNF